MNRAVIFQEGEAIAPFSKRVDDCVVGQRSLKEQRRESLRRAGFSRDLETETGDPAHMVEGPALIWADNVYVAPRALRTFVQRAQTKTHPVRFCLPHHQFFEALSPLQDVPFDAETGYAYSVAWVPKGHTISIGDAFSLPTEQWLSPTFRYREIPVPRPPYISKTIPETFLLSSTFAIRIRHWVHLLRLSHMMPGLMLLDAAYRHWGWTSQALLRSVRLSKKSRERALKKNLVRRGKNVFIHPTACVEASVLGHNVHIGPYAYVVGSVLGDDVFVEDRAHVHQSCLGPKTFVSRNSSISACLSFGETDVCTNGIQACVVAEKCALTSFARPLDLNPNGPVKVWDNGQIREVGPLPCGVAFGPGVFIGADVTIAPGREVPAGISIYASPEQVVRTLPKECLEGSQYVVDSGTLKLLVAPK